MWILIAYDGEEALGTFDCKEDAEDMQNFLVDRIMADEGWNEKEAEEWRESAMKDFPVMEVDSAPSREEVIAKFNKVYATSLTVS